MRTSSEVLGRAAVPAAHVSNESRAGRGTGDRIFHIGGFVCKRLGDGMARAVGAADEARGPVFRAKIDHGKVRPRQRARAGPLMVTALLGVVDHVRPCRGAECWIFAPGQGIIAATATACKLVAGKNGFDDGQNGRPKSTSMAHSGLVDLRAKGIARKAPGWLYRAGWWRSARQRRDVRLPVR